MRKKLMYLAAALVMCGMPMFMSCSKDDEPSQTIQDVSVANTMWRADDGTIYKFYADGTCELGGALQKYHQVGSEINIVGNFAWYNKHLYYTRYAYVKGNVMTIEVRQSLKEPFTTINVYKVK